MLSWQDAAVVAGCLAVASVLGRLLLPGTFSRLRSACSLAWEAGLLFGLYALWQFAGTFSVMGGGGGLARGEGVWHAERLLHLPSESAVQRPFLPHPLIIEAFNLYYD